LASAARHVHSRHPLGGAVTAGLLVADLIDTRGAPGLARRTAVAGDDWSITYGQLAEDARRWQRLLHDAGIRPGDRIALLAGNGPTYLSLLYGAARSGVVVVLLNTRLNAESVHYQLEDSVARLVVIGAEHAALGQESGAYDLPTITLDDDHDRRLATVDPAPLTLASRPDPVGAFIQLYTSGTTGRAKGCVLSQSAWVSSAINLVTRLRMTDADVHIAAAPFFHVAGLGAAMSVLSAGGRVVFGSTRSLDETWDLIARHGVTIGTFVGGGVVNAVRHPMCAANAKSLRLLTGQAGKHTAAEHAEMSELVPQADFVGIYGSTEAGNYSVCSSRTDEIARPGTVGRPLIGFRAAVVDAEDRIVEQGVAGELVLRGPSVMTEYWRMPEATVQTLRRGWLHTGDIMRMDDDGYLFMLDRLKDMVKSGGENVYSIEVEQALIEHPGVRDVAVIGVPDTRWGEGVKAVVVTDNGVDAEVLDTWCLAHLAAYKRPRWYQFTDALPANGLKIDKKRLRAEHDPATSIRLPERS
jgi:acyl-CoA synthetase (AMP-forming)/AMP-acid ligase II